MVFKKNTSLSDNAHQGSLSTETILQRNKTAYNSEQVLIRTTVNVKSVYIQNPKIPAVQSSTGLNKACLR
jgi:hypothetical protein